MVEASLSICLSLSQMLFGIIVNSFLDSRIDNDYVQNTQENVQNIRAIFSNQSNYYACKMANTKNSDTYPQ